MSVYNGALYLREALDSVLGQSFSDFEFLIVDDGSTDDSCAIVKSYDDARIQLFQQKNTGVAGAKNLALRKAQGQWIAIIDSDDIWKAEKLQKQIDFLEANPEYVTVGTFAQIIDKDGNPLYVKRKVTGAQEISDYLEKGNIFTHSSVVFDRQKALELGGYYEKVKQYFVDYMLLYQLNQLGKSENLAEPLTLYRIVPTSLSAKNDPPEFHRIMHDTIKRGHITEEDYQILKNIKVKENKSKGWRLSNYYYYIGRVHLFYHFNRGMAIKNFAMAVKIYPTFAKAWVYFGMSLFFPKKMVQRFYQKYFGNSEQMLNG